MENKEENDVFPYLVQERKHKRWKILGTKIHSGSQIFILPIWEEKWEEKREKWGLALELHIYLIDVLYVSFFSFLFYYGNLRACDLWVRSLTPCLFFHFVPFFFFLILFICVRKTPFLFSIVLVFIFWKKIFGFLNFLSSFYFIFLMKKSFIHIFLIKI